MRSVPCALKAHATQIRRHGTLYYAQWFGVVVSVCCVKSMFVKPGPRFFILPGNAEGLGYLPYAGLFPRAPLIQQMVGESDGLTEGYCKSAY